MGQRLVDGGLVAGKSKVDRIIRGPIVDDWHRRAACANKPTAWWYADIKDDNNALTPSARKALSKCFTCPVRRKCLTHALTYPEYWGIWGATTEHQRRRIRSLMLAGELSEKQAIEAAWDVAAEVGHKFGLLRKESA